ncbi:hypothetical protein [Pectinatus haikarae]|uniref:hypothetical protein n=1 Tax=Pectinatus haikarae TaxID=349096 RepID=UPI0018C5A860|nr:hypothetical protein [Pectinatus haikarae]
MSKIEKPNSFEESILKLTNGKCGKLFKIGAIGLVAAIPDIAPAVALFSAIGESCIKNLEQQNLFYLAEAWADKNLDEKFDEGNNAQVELVTHAVFKAIRCSKKKQIYRIADILNGNFSNQLGYDDAEDCINIISELSENEAIILFKIYNSFRSQDSPDYSKPLTKPFEMSINQFELLDESNLIRIVPEFSDNLNFFLGRLSGKGLLKEELSLEIQHNNIKRQYKRTYTGRMIFNAISDSK